MKLDDIRADIKHKRELITTHKRRLHLLEMQKVQFGLYLPPHIQIEIDNITAEIQQLEQAIRRLEQELPPPPPPPDPTDAYQFDLFISYSRRDRDAVMRLVDRLREDSIRLWIDEDQIGGGDPLREVIVKGIEQSQHIICCLSPNYLNDSKWGAFESAVNQTLDVDNKKRRLIPVQIAPVNIPPEYAWLYCPDLTDPAIWEQEYQKTIRHLRKQ